MRKPIYNGRLIQLSLDTVTLPNNAQVDLEIVHHPGGAVVVAVNGHNEVCLLRQYRYAAKQQHIWELPAGCIDASDASPQITARRELHEEAGVQARQWTDLGAIYTSPGFCDEKLYLFLAQELHQGSTQHQADELIQVHWRPVAEALSMARDGEIIDAKSITALFRADAVLAQQD